MNRTLRDWLAWLETLHPSAIELGLARVRAVAQRLDVLSPGVPVVTIAGTNGKGSTGTLLAALFTAHGRRCGHYTSPHLQHFNERIAVDGVPVPDDAIVAALEQVEAVRGDVSLTYFEYTTLAALLVFRAARVEALVLEVGLGGRLDAVNIVDADVAVLTTVGIDHTDWLGPDRESIGREKAGIFRAARPAVIGETDPPASVLAAADAFGARQVRRGRDFDALVDGDHWRFTRQAATSPPLPLPVLPLDNAATALAAFCALGLTPDWSRVATVLAGTRLRGRNQRIDVGGRAVVLDVGHNPQALACLRGELARHGLGERWHVLLAMLGDKDIESAVRVLQPLAESWHIAPLPTPRGADADHRLGAAIAAAGAVAQRHASVAEALDVLLAGDVGLPVLVTGSFHTVEAALDKLADPARQRE